MVDLVDIEIRALQYVVNTGGGAQIAHFKEDHEPIGERLWSKFVYMGLVRTNSTGHIFLTEKGNALLEGAA